MTGIVGLISMKGVLTGRLTVGTDGSIRKGWSAPGIVNAPGFGAMTPVTFRDRAGVTRTLNSIIWRSTGSLEIDLGMSGSVGDPPDTDATFKQLTIGSRVLVRSARTTYGAWAFPGVAWGWFTQTDPFGAVGSVLTVRIE